MFIRMLVLNFCLLTAGAFGFMEQQAAAPPASFVLPPTTPNDTLKSPEVAANGRVTFRLYAPNAHEVKLQAEGAEATPGISNEEMMKSMAGHAMTKGADGVWTFEFGPVQPGVYRYTFVVDGVQTTDPRNPVSSESLNTVKSM